MSKSIKVYKKDLDNLIKKGENLYYSLLHDEEINKFQELYKSLSDSDKKKIRLVNFKGNYQEWYTESYMLIKNLIYDRLDDFVSLYKQVNGKRGTTNIYTVEQYIHYSKGPLDGIDIWDRKSYNQYEPIVITFGQQLSILKSVRQKFESSLFQIKDLMQAQLFDDELDTAKELNKKGFTRAAGAVAGVVIEGHLKNLCDNHNLKIEKKNPTIGDYNNTLYNKGIIEIDIYRRIQLLGDLRNLCDHKKDKEPTKENIEELIIGTDKIIKTVA